MREHSLLVLSMQKHREVANGPRTRDQNSTGAQTQKLKIHAWGLRRVGCRDNGNRPPRRYIVPCTLIVYEHWAQAGHLKFDERVASVLCMLHDTTLFTARYFLCPLTHYIPSIDVTVISLRPVLTPSPKLFLHLHAPQAKHHHHDETGWRDDNQTNYASSTMIDVENLRTASLYINNQLLSRGLLRDGRSIDFARPGDDDYELADTMGRIMSVVNDLILRRDVCQ